ncbi:MAG: 7TM diverse intracellular signaling domain-containing protein, partial [Candidatus Kapaibacteriota bacterium]
MHSVTRITPQTRTINLVSSTEYLFDSSHQLSITDITQPKYSSAFQHKPSGALVFGWTNDAVWVRTRIGAENGADTLSWILDVGFMSLDSVSFFIPAGTPGQWRELRSGSHVPFRERDERYARVVFPLMIPPPDSVLTVYVRVTSSNSIYLNMVAVERQTWENRLEEHDLMIVLFLGMIFSAFLYNAVMFVSMRDKLYGYYIFYTASVLCAYSTIHGLVLKHFFPFIAPNASLIISASLCLAYIGALLFGKEFLATKLYAPLFERGMVYCAWFIGVCILPILVFPMLGWVLPVLSTIGNILLIIAALLSARKGYRPAWFYLVAWLMFFCGATYFGAVSSGVIVADTTPIFTILTASTAFELTMFSFILAYRFRRLRDDAENAEHERIFAEQQRELEHRKNMELQDAQHRLQESFASVERF